MDGVQSSDDCFLLNALDSIILMIERQILPIELPLELIGHLKCLCC